MSKIVALALLVAIAAPGIALAAPGDDEDRYGPPPAPFVDPVAPDSTQPTLTWPSKLAVSAPRRPTPQVYAPQVYARPAPAAFAAPAQPSAPPLPTSIYAPTPQPTPASTTRWLAESTISTASDASWKRRR